MNLLHIESSLFAEGGVSSLLSRELVATLKAKHNLEVTHLEFAKNPVPHFDANVIAALTAQANALTPEQKPLLDYANTQIELVQKADVLVFGVPMYNFGVPSMLKAWLDFIARAGVTFKYTEQGPVGLLHNKKAYIVTTRGGIHKESATDSQIPFLKTFLGFIGITDVEVIYAEGLNMGDDNRNSALANARQTFSEIAA